MMVSKGLVVLLAALLLQSFSSTPPMIIVIVVADRAYSTTQWKDYSNKLRVKGSTHNIGSSGGRKGVDNSHRDRRYSIDNTRLTHGGQNNQYYYYHDNAKTKTQEHQGSSSSSSSSSSSNMSSTTTREVGGRQNMPPRKLSFVTKVFFLVAFYCYVQFLAPRTIHFLGMLCREISAFKKSIETRSEDIALQHRHTNLRQTKHPPRKRRSSSCNNGQNMEVRYLKERVNNNYNEKANKSSLLLDPTQDDGKSISSSIMDILGLTELGDGDNDDDDDNDEEQEDGYVHELDTNFEDESFISNNSTISTVSTFLSYVRFRRNGATPLVTSTSSAKTSTHVNTNKRSPAQHSDLSSSLPETLHFIPKGKIHDKANNWLDDDASHNATITINYRNDSNNNKQRRKSHIRMVGPAYV